MKAAFIRLTGFLTTVLSDILILYHCLLCKISDNQRQPSTHCYIERHPVREKQQNHDNKATRCVICRIDWILLTVKKKFLEYKKSERYFNAAVTQLSCNIGHVLLFFVIL